MDAINNIIVDEEFRTLIPPLSEEEYKGLEQDMIANGCMVPLILWPQPDGTFILIDGHNRYEICKKHNIPFKANTRMFSSRAEALTQIINLQLNRRNLTDYARVELALKYDDILRKEGKKAQSEGGKHSQEVQKLKKEQENAEPDAMNDVPKGFAPPDSIMEEPDIPEGPDFDAGEAKQDEKDKGTDANDRRTDAQIGKLAGVSRGTVAKVRKIQQESSPEIQEKLKKGEMNISQADTIARLPEEQKTAAEERIISGEDVKAVVKEVREDGLPGAKEDELYTPKMYTDSAVSTMGFIDLDPASCVEADRTIDADRIYTKADNGLKQSWNGRIWLNPPRAGDKQETFTKKLLQEWAAGNVTQACVMVDADTNKKWFHELLHEATAILFIKGSVEFQGPAGKAVFRPHPQVILYMGTNTDKFLKVFGKYGVCATIQE